MTARRSGWGGLGRRLAVVGLAVALAGCGLSGGDEPLSAGELEELLPLADELGPSWREVGSDDEGEEGADALHTALQEACPELAALVGAETGDADAEQAEATADFEDDHRAPLDVDLTSPADDITADRLEDLVNSTDACGEIELADNSTLELLARLDDTYGELGYRFSAELTLELTPGTELGTRGLGSVAIRFIGVVFTQGAVGVEVTTGGTVADSTLEPIPPDEDLLAEVAGDLEDGAAEAQG